MINKNMRFFLMLSLFILIYFFLLTLFPKHPLHSAQVPQIELSCAAGQSPFPYGGQIINPSTGKLRQWECVDNQGNVFLTGRNPLYGAYIFDGCGNLSYPLDWPNSQTAVSFPTSTFACSTAALQSAINTAATSPDLSSVVYIPGRQLIYCDVTGDSNCIEMSNSHGLFIKGDGPDSTSITMQLNTTLPTFAVQSTSYASPTATITISGGFHTFIAGKYYTITGSSISDNNRTYYAATGGNGSFTSTTSQTITACAASCGNVVFTPVAFHFPPGTARNYIDGIEITMSGPSSTTQPGICFAMEATSGNFTRENSIRNAVCQTTAIAINQPGTVGLSLWSNPNSLTGVLLNRFDIKFRGINQLVQSLGDQQNRFIIDLLQPQTAAPPNGWGLLAGYFYNDEMSLNMNMVIAQAPAFRALQLFSSLGVLNHVVMLCSNNANSFCINDQGHDNHIEIYDTNQDVNLGTRSTTSLTEFYNGNFAPQVSGGSYKFLDQGTCTMAAGTCTVQSLSHTYAAAPNCIGTWNGAGTLSGILKIPSTTTTATPASTAGTDTAQVNWFCFGS